MKKQELERFISKYYLKGLTGPGRWVKENGALRVSVKTETGGPERVLAIVKWNNFTAFDDAEIGILDTESLLGFVKDLPCKTFSLALQKDAVGEVNALVFHRPKRDLQFATGMNHIEKESRLKKVPPYNAEIKLDFDFITCFQRAHDSVGGAPEFMVAMSERTGKLEVCLGCLAGYGCNGVRYFNRVSIQPETVNNKDTVTAPICFPKRFLKEILKVNSECSDPILKVSDEGLASIYTSHEDLDCEYHFEKCLEQD